MEANENIENEQVESGDDFAPEETSLREDLEAALEGAGEEIEEGHEASQAPKEQEAEKEIQAEGGQDAQATAAAAPASKPPVGWGVGNKEKWNELPEEIKQEVHNREVQINKLMENTANDRRTAQSVNQLVSGYQAVFAAEGVQNPIEGIQGLLNITATLQSGNQNQKAERIAGLIKHYGVDIGELDSILAGEAPDPQQSQMSQVEAMVNQRMQPIEQQFQMAQQQQIQQKRQVAATNIEQFAQDPQNRFFNDVRHQMADFMDVARNNGQPPMSLQDAYNRACAMNPEIANILAQERAGQYQQSNNSRMMGKRNAASSISGRRASAGDNIPEEASLRDTLERLWDSQTG